MEEKKLIYDIGLHLGYDTQMYLEKGYKVIAVEANPVLTERAKKVFAKYLKKGQLILLNCAIAENDFEKIPFYISNENSIQSSLQKNMAERESTVQEVLVDSFKLSTLFEKYGTPYYCKIDIEGYDYFALSSLLGNKSIPKYISAEVNNVAFNGDTVESISDIKQKIEIWLSILDKLQELGYNKFKLVDQYTLKVISKDIFLYDQIFFNKGLITKIYYKSIRMWVNLRNKLSINTGYLFDCSGPFAESLSGSWEDYDSLRKIIIQHGENMEKNGVKVMWCDIHGTI